MVTIEIQIPDVPKRRRKTTLKKLIPNAGSTGLKTTMKLMELYKKIKQQKKSTKKKIKSIFK